MFKNISKIGMLLILILLAFFLVEALNIKEGISSDMIINKDNSKDENKKEFNTINNFSIGSNY